jgi:hypothetical protein
LAGNVSSSWSGLLELWRLATVSRSTAP